jgi:hypothetical protein
MTPQLKRPGSCREIFMDRKFGLLSKSSIKASEAPCAYFDIWLWAQLPGNY